MSTNKPHKATLKRMRISATGLVKHKSANSKHLKSNKSGKRLQKLRKDRRLFGSQVIGVEQLLFRRLRGIDQPRATIRKSPTPAEAKALKAKKSATAPKAARDHRWHKGPTKAGLALAAKKN